MSLFLVWLKLSKEKARVRSTLLSTAWVFLTPTQVVANLSTPCCNIKNDFEKIKACFAGRMNLSTQQPIILYQIDQMVRKQSTPPPQANMKGESNICAEQYFTEIIESIYTNHFRQSAQKRTLWQFEKLYGGTKGGFFS